MKVASFRTQDEIELNHMLHLIEWRKKNAKQRLNTIIAVLAWSSAVLLFVIGVFAL